jgi:hypothetical protein
MDYPMPNAQEKSFGEKFNIWVQTIGIIIGSIVVFLWGVTTFVYEKIWVPKSAPVNVSLDIALKKTGICEIKENKNQAPLAAIELKITAKNPSTRAVPFLPSSFFVFGYKIAGTDGNDEDFSKRSDEVLKDFYSGTISRRHSMIKTVKVVAVGDLFIDSGLKPAEVVSTSRVFHIPSGEYDMLEAVAFIPSCKERSIVELTRKFDQERGIIQGLIRISDDGRRDPIKPDETGYIVDERLGLHTTVNRTMISLW